MKRLILLTAFLTTLFLQAQQNGGTPVKDVIPIQRTHFTGEAKKAKQTAQKVNTTSIIPTGNSTEVGFTGGQLSVSLTGGATYTIPIAVPPGINGVTPSVSLSYNSQGGNGMAGYGWNIGGISVITRIPSTKFHDNTIDAVDFDGLDRFALDGQRLLLKSGSYGGDGAVYQTESYSNLKITSHGTSPYGTAYGPAYFKVAYPDGSVAYYGYTDNSRSMTDYAVSYRENPQGIRLDYSYNKTDHTPLSIDKITYGHTAETAAVNEIQFEYRDRIRPERSYIGGNVFLINTILNAIHIKSNGVGYRNYLLTHNTTTLRYERLVSIQEKSGDNSKSYNPTVFSYATTPEEIDYTLSQTELSVGNIKQHNAGIVSGDYDGDGKMDFIVHPSTESAQDKYWLFTGVQNEAALNIGVQHNVGRFEAMFPAKWLNHNNKLMPMQGWVIARHPNQSDYDDQVNFTMYSAGITSSIYNQYEKQFAWPSATMLPNQVGVKGMYLGGDFNGDGLTDMIILRHKDLFRICEDPGCYDWADQWENSSENKQVVFLDMDRRLTTDYYNIAGELQDKLKDDTQVRIADVTGDGKSNLLIFDNDILRVYGLNDSNQLMLLWETSDTHISVSRPILLGDYNGDGKTDFIIPKGYGHYYAHYRATGNGFTKSDAYYALNYKENKDLPHGLFNHSDYFAQNTIAIDINNDGKTDLVQLESKKYGGEAMKYTVKVYEKHNSFSLRDSKTVTGGKKYPAPVFLNSDTPNHDLEIGMMSDNEIFHFQYLKDFNKEKLLRQVTNGYGITQAITYKPLKQTYQYEDNMLLYETSSYTEAYPNVDIDIAPGFQVVSKIEKAGTHQLFGYYGAVSNVEGLGFLGFRAVAKTNWHNASLPAMTTISRHDPALRGAVTESYTILNKPWSLKNDPTNFITKTTYNYEAELLPDKVFKLKNTAVETLNQQDGTSAIVSNIFNEYNNITSTTSILKQGEQVQQTTVTDFSYENNPEGEIWYIGRLLGKTQSVTAYGSTMTATENYLYNAQHLPIQIQKTGHQTEAITETLTYDNYGNVSSRAISAGGLAPRTTQYEYDNSGRFLIKSTDMEGLQIQYSHDPNTGLLLSRTSPYGLETIYGYDVWGKKTQQTNYLGKNIIYSYTKSGNTYSVTETGEDGSFSIAVFDAYGRQIRSGAKNTTDTAYKSFQYDDTGKKIKESEPYFGDGPSQWNDFLYDAYDRLIQTVAYTGKITNISYNGLSVTVNDGIQTVMTTKNAMGHTIEHIDDGGVVTYWYYPNGNLKQADYDGVVVSIQQDGWGRKTQLSDPSAGIYTYQYNAFGEITQETTPKGATTYTYNSEGRLTKKEISGEATDMETEYSYDPVTKQMTTMGVLSNGQEFTYGYTYDEYSRPVSATEQTPYAQFERLWQYDDFGRMEKEGYHALDNATGKALTQWVRHHYKNGLPWQLRDDTDGSLLWYNAEVNARGQLSEGYYGNGIKATHSYDNFGFLSGINYQHDPKELLTEGQEPTPPTPVMDLAYDFNPQTATLNSRSNSLFNWEETFTYDNLNRLTGFTDNNGSQEQTYDNRGRITQNPNTGDYTYNANHPYQATQVELTPQGYEYYRERGRQTLSYNAFKKPVNIRIEGRARIDFSYNTFKQRSSMFYGSDAEGVEDRPLQKHYAFDGSMEIRTNAETGEATFVVYLGGDAYGAQVVLKSDGEQSEFLYLHRDYLGSILAITNQDAEMLEKRHFDAWGNIVYMQDGQNNDLDVLTVLDRGYTGHEHLQGVELIHMNGRLYDALLHRFLAPDNYVQDPYNTQNFNRYGYVLNNPLLYVDPSGELFKEIGKWIKDNAEIITFVATVAVAVVATVATAGMASPILAGVIVGGAAGFTAGAVGTWTSGGSFGDGLTNGLIQGAIGAVAGGVGAGAGAWASQHLGGVAIQGLNISGPAVKGMFGGVIGGGFGGFAGGTASGLLSGESFGDALALGAKGALFGAAVGGLVGTAQGIKYAKANNLDPWSGDVRINKAIGAAPKGFSDNRVLQSGGQSLKPNTLKALNLTKDQGRNAIHALKSDWGLPNNFHGKIMSNGDYLHPSTGERIGNLFDYLF